MKTHWFIKFLLAAICLKFLMHGIWISLLLAFILGFKVKDTVKTIHSVILGGVLGLESAILLTLFSSWSGFSMLLSIVRTLGFPVSYSLSYATINFIAFAYIIVIEMILVAIVVKIGEWVADVLEKRSIQFHW